MTREEKLAAAGAYVLGELDDAGRAALESQMLSDSELRNAVDRLAARMQALDDTVVPEPPSVTLWQRIEGKLDDRATPPGPAHTASAPTARRPSMEWLAIAASIVIAAGAGFWAGGGFSPRPEPVVIAVLMNESSAMPGAIIEAFADDSIAVVPLEDFDVPEGRVLQVWTLPDPATGPVSLGTLQAAGSMQLVGPHLPVPAEGQLYEITLEPAPGSPTGRPTGPILVKGFARLPL